jgi:ATP-dependent DNA helicase RecG
MVSRGTVEKTRGETVEKTRGETVEKTRGETVEKTRGETVKKIVSLLKGSPNITVRDLVQMTGLTRRGIEWNLRELKKAGRIRRVDPDKGGHWEVIDG